MEINLDRILSHANERLSSASGAARAEQLDAFKRFLKIETERLRIRHRFGLGGEEIASGRSYQVDLVVSRACQLVASEFEPALHGELAQCALVALGGYGRRELAPCSDVDILFLHPGRPSQGVKKFVEQVLILLWDIGLTIGHSFRSVAECVAIARQDLHSRTSMAEARLITGHEPMYRQLVRELDEAVFKSKRDTAAFLESMRFEMEERYTKFGKAVCLQEPNVKESAGGLRDLHTVLWVGHACYGCWGLEVLREESHIAGVEYAQARRAYDFLARVRNEAHFSTGRKTDLLTLDLQPSIASNLGYKPKGGLAASEIFMRTYYQRANELHRFCESFLVRAGSRPEKKGFRFRFRRPKVRGSFEVRDGRLYARGRSSDFGGSAHRMLEAFDVAQDEGIDLSDELKLQVRENLSLVDRRFQHSKEASRVFLRILGRRGRVSATLRVMHDTGFLGRYMPEIARVTFLVQHDFYHRYTVDEHTLKAIEALDEIVIEGSKGIDPAVTRFREVFDEVEDTTSLYLGMLLHDIGKGRGGGHVAKGVRIAERVCERLRVDEKTADEAVFLVRCHLVMSHLSQRRDLSEENLTLGFVSTVGSLERLNLLLLLTYADHRAVGPGVWNDWKATLLWELYGQAHARLSGETPAWDEDRRARIKDGIVEDLMATFPLSEIERHIAMLPERYLRSTDASQMSRHFRLLEKLETQPLAAEWRVLEAQHCTELTICTRDAPGLLARLAGTLSANGLNILSVDLYTREDGIALDTFKVCEASSFRPVELHRWPRIEADLVGAVAGTYDVAQAIEAWKAKSPPRPRRKGHKPVEPTVKFDSETSATSTVIEVQIDDQPGLVYRIASTLASLGLNITFAKIATEKSHALDVFYVTDAEGQKLGPQQMPPVEGALVEALGGRPVTKAMKEAG